MNSSSGTRVELKMGALCDDIEDQLQRQGLTLGDANTVKQVQRWADVITDLGLQEFLTLAERNKARKRLMKRISALALPLKQEANR